MKLAAAIEHTFATRPSWRDGKGRQTAAINAEHVLRILGSDYDCSKATATDLIMLQRALMQEVTPRGPRSAAGINRILAAATVILREVHYLGELDHVPSVRQLKEPKGRLEYYTREEIENMLETAWNMGLFELRDTILFCYKTGCRQGEALALCVSDVDLANHQVTFRDTKNGTDHSISITPDVVEMLGCRVEDRHPDTPIFDYVNRDQLLRQFKKVRDACGISQEKLFHTIRHTTGTLLAEAGVPIRTIMGILNHQNINTTLRYAKATDKSKEEALALL
jgi:integrase